MLKIEQLDVKERSGRYLLKDISMEIPAGRVIGLTGKSGSGKTTLLRSILGMLHTSCHIDAGKILLDDTTWNTEGSYTEPHKFLQESLGADPHAISLQALEDFQSYSDAVNAFSTSADPEVVQSAIATALNVSNDNVIDLPISYSKDLVVYNSSKIAGYTFSSVPQFFEIDNVQPAE